MSLRVPQGQTRGFDRCVSPCFSRLPCASVWRRRASPSRPDRLDHYRLVPGLSTLTESGGFAGGDTRYRLRGEYDFLQEWSGGTPTEPLELIPRFDNVDIRAPLGDLLPAFIDVGHLFNMELLRGELIPQPFAFTPFEVFRFTGIANDSPAASPLEQSLVELYAVTYGPWMYLRGETIPAPGRPTTSSTTCGRWPARGTGPTTTRTALSTSRTTRGFATRRRSSPRRATSGSMNRSPDGAEITAVARPTSACLIGRLRLR